MEEDSNFREEEVNEEEEQMDPYYFLIKELEEDKIDRNNPHFEFLNKIRENNEELVKIIDDMGNLIQYGVENIQTIPDSEEAMKENVFNSIQYQSHKEFIDHLENSISSVSGET